jgi:hypothetical protein
VSPKQRSGSWSACALALIVLPVLLATAPSARGANTANQASDPAPGCLASFEGPLTRLDRDYGYQGFEVATWPSGARFDARGGRWTSLMDGTQRRRSLSPIQIGVDWGTNVDGAGRRDLWSARYNTPPQPTPFCFFGGTIVGTQPRDATWGETKALGGGYAITINGRGGVVEGVRVDNHHDAFVPYRADGFVFRGNWVSYNRDDCIENDGHAEGTIADNLFDGCYNFYSGYNGVHNGAEGAGADGTVRIVGNLIRLENMPGPYDRRNRQGDPGKSGYERLLKTRKQDARVPKLVLRDNVIAYEVPRDRGSTALRAAHVRITECANNIILWFGDGKFPGPIPDDLSGCFTIATGAAAQRRWATLRQRWIDAHPEVARL